MNMTTDNIAKHRADANVAFELAIAQGRLSASMSAANYAGDYMWMGFNPKTGDAFKHRAPGSIWHLVAGPISKLAWKDNP